MTATTSELSASLQSPMTLATNAHGVKELTYVSWSTLPPLPGKLQRLMTLNVERRRITCISMSLDLPIHQGLIPQGVHLTRRFSRWVPRRKVAVGRCPEAS